MCYFFLTYSDIRVLWLILYYLALLCCILNEIIQDIAQKFTYSFVTTTQIKTSLMSVKPDLLVPYQYLYSITCIISVSGYTGSISVYIYTGIYRVLWHIHLTSSNESETGRGLLFLSAAILFYNVFFVFLEINLANSISLFFFFFATAILLFTVLNAQTPD